MTVVGQSSYHKTTRLLAAVECQIKVNPGSLHIFLSVLREDPSLVYIADTMSDEYRKFVLLYIHIILHAEYSAVMYHALISGKLGCYKYACKELRS